MEQRRPGISGHAHGYPECLKGYENKIRNPPVSILLACMAAAGKASAPCKQARDLSEYCLYRICRQHCGATMAAIDAAAFHKTEHFVVDIDDSEAQMCRARHHLGPETKNLRRQCWRLNL